MTFSIVARSADARQFGVAIASSSPAVAARCAYAQSGVGAVVTQNITDPALGPATLAHLATQKGAADALAAALETTSFAAYRQLAAIGAAGRGAIHTGERALGITAAALGAHAACAGNLLANPDVPAAMLAAFEEPPGEFGSRLVAALRAGAAAGGEARPIHSAGLLIVRDMSWPIVDLRVDWSDENPTEELASLWVLYRPQIEDYVQRAIDPSRAPSFGVSGEKNGRPCARE